MADDERSWQLLMDKLNGMDTKLDSVIALTNKHEVAIEQAKFVGKLAHLIGWPALMAGIHHMWQQIK